MELAMSILFWLLFSGSLGVAAVLLLIIAWPNLEEANENTQISIVAGFVVSALVWAIGLIGCCGLGVAKFFLSS